MQSEAQYHDPPLPDAEMRDLQIGVVMGFPALVGHDPDNATGLQQGA